MNEGALNLVDHVLPDVPIRQFVATGSTERCSGKWCASPWTLWRQGFSDREYPLRFAHALQ